MGGIVGAFSADRREIGPDLLARMTGLLRHRGPDDEGYVFLDSSTGRCEARAGADTEGVASIQCRRILDSMELWADLGLGHRRLAVVDPSPAGHQPMSSEDGTVWIVYDGEIYNHHELREELKSCGYMFRSETDTEVVLRSYERWGAECLRRFNGMWAFAVWDCRQRRLICSVDHFGIKPFYYYFDGRRFLFASEIKSLLEARFVERRPNDQAVFDYLTVGIEGSAEETFFQGIRRLQGGHYLEFRPADSVVRLEPYYRLPHGQSISELADDEHAAQFYHLLKDSVRLRLASDVPVGTCLSGGIDSSSIVCIIDSLLRENPAGVPGIDGRQRIYSVRYHDRRYDEGVFIDQVVEKVAADAHSAWPTAEGLWRHLQDVVWHQDEPFSSTRSYAQWEVYRFARQSGVKVVLDGQGGDELLGGYDWFFPILFSYLARSLQWRKMAREYVWHTRMHRGLAASTASQALYLLLPQTLQQWIFRVARRAGTRYIDRDFASGFRLYHFREGAAGGAAANLFEERQYEAFTHSLLPGLLRHQDRSSLAHSLESRTPFLDVRVVEYAFAAPWEQKIRNGTRKVMLRSATKGIIPEGVAKRQDKMPFPAPQDTWVRELSRMGLIEILTSQSFRQRPYLNAREVERELKADQQGRSNNHNIIWRWLSLELWLRRFIDR